MPTAQQIAKLAGSAVLAAGLLAGLLFPLAGGFGLVSNKAADTVDNVSAEIMQGRVPAISTMLDANGRPIAFLYEQRRTEVPSSKISNDMKLALVSIEDRRFAEHHGVDWQGSMRALLRNTSSGEVEQGASTIDQQYIKNYELLVVAKTDAERRAATETTMARKLREIRMALTLDKSLTKDEILTRYLNLVPFGNGSYGVQDAAQTYFGENASQLALPQAAMLAGMVQSSSALDPYTNPKGVLDRRNTVLHTMLDTVPNRASEIHAALQQPLGVLPEPKIKPRGCIAAGNRGFFCDYVLQYLSDAGIGQDQVDRGGYTIKTTLDPAVQDSVHNALAKMANPDLENIAQVMNVVAPGTSSHKVLAMSSSRTYGLDVSRHETVQPEPFSMVGDGAGSIFKIFTTAAAMEKGLGTSAELEVPPTYAAKGMGNGGLPGCPPATYCVKNAGNYRSPLSVTEALATSPNTAFVKLIQEVGVVPTVNMALKLGLRSYGRPGTAGQGDQSLADMFKTQNLGSFTLGPTPVNPLELSNVAATLASGGRWCPASPIASITDQDGKPVPLSEQACQQVLDPGLAHTLANAMSKDDQPGGTSAASASASGWNVPVSAKTGTTETSKSSAFLGFTNSFAGASYVYGDNGNTEDICTSPLRNCSNGNVFGGEEPAHAWYTAMKNVLNEFPPSVLPPTEEKYVRGAANAQVPNVVGQSQESATATLLGSGFKVTPATQSNSAAKGTVVGMTPSGSAVPGSAITIYISDGSAPVAPTAPAPAAGPGPGDLPPLPRLPFNIPLPPIPGAGGN